MNCFTCKTAQCCPEHCCNWDTCKCMDCENCGGPTNSVKEIPSASSSKRTVPSSEDLRQFSKPLVSPKKEEEMSIMDIINITVQERLKEQRAQEAETKRANDERRSIERAKYDEILASSRATITKNREVLESTQSTLERVQSVIDGVKDTEKRFQDFQDSFGRVMAQNLERAFGLGGFENIEEMKTKHGRPRETSIEEVASILGTAESVSIITGAGISAESGVYTYKDSQETWDVGGRALTMQGVMNINILQEYPLEFWQNIQYNRVRMGACSPNAVHHALSDLLHYFRQKGKKACMVTQNIDGFDRQVMGNDKDLFEIHEIPI